MSGVDGKGVSTDSNGSVSAAPVSRGRFGVFGGRYVPETLVHALDQLEHEYALAQKDGKFQADLANLLRTFVGRPTPLYRAQRLSQRVGGNNITIWLKREDLAHTGAHKINNTIGQTLLTMRMGKKRVIAETGAGQHGVATATAAAHFGLTCDVYMGAEDVRRQRLNVVRMKLLGANVKVVDAGSRTLKDATNEAMRDWMASVQTTHYILGSVVGPHPFPTIVRDFQSVIGSECREQCMKQIGRLPDAVIACVGGGSNAAGMFHPFVVNDEKSIRTDQLKLVGVEAGGRSTDMGHHAATLSFGSPGVLHGSMSYVLQSKDGQTADVHSVSAGLDYPGVGPEHSFWKDEKLVKYVYATDKEALEAFQMLAETEGIIPALESAHAVAYALKLADTMGYQSDSERHIVINLSGRGDKDVDEAARLMQLPD